jgi:hypothetical protein
VSSIPQKGAIDLPEALGRLIDLQTATNKLDEVKMWPDERSMSPWGGSEVTRRAW